MSNALMIPGTALSDMQLGEVMAQSGYFKDARDATQAIVKILYGREIGIGPVSAMMGVNIIEGKPAPTANLIAARVKSSGRYDYRVREHSLERCRVEFFERGGKDGWESLGTVEWTMEDARRAELANKGNWKKYPRAMLFARAISEGARTYCPEVFGGAPVYTPEELGAEVDGDGNLILPPANPLTDTNGNGSARQLATEPQAKLIRDLMRSRVFTNEERASIEKKLAEGFKGSVTQAIDGIKAEITSRKDVINQQQAEYLEGALAAVDTQTDESVAGAWSDDDEAA